jgi:hypothetical protein
MGYDKGPTKRNRIVVPTAPRATIRKPPRPDRAGMKSAIIDAAIVAGAILFTTLFLLFISGQLYDTTSGNLTARSAAPQLTAFAQPTPLATRLARPSPSARPTQSAATPTPTPAGGTVAVSNDSAIQTEIDKGIAGDPDLANLGIKATFANGKATLAGTVSTDELKDRIEKLVRAVKGVREVDNQIVVVNGLVCITCRREQGGNRERGTLYPFPFTFCPLPFARFR